MTVVPETLEEVGKEFNVTRERIRQIEAKALRKLKHPTRSKRLKDFVDKILMLDRRLQSILIWWNLANVVLISVAIMDI